MNLNETKHRAKDAVDDVVHSGKVDKAKGHTKEIIGSAKEKLGSLVGDHELEAKGHLQNVEGKKDRIKGEIKEVIEDATDKVKAGVEVIKDKINEVRGK